MALAAGTHIVPDWLLRAGYGRLVLVPVDETDATVTNKGHVDTTAVLPLAYAPETERRVTGRGTLEATAKVRRITPEVAGWPEVRQLRAWGAACYRVRGVVLAQGRGRHILINEPVPPERDPFANGRGTLEGDRFVLETQRYDAEWTEDVDLLALSDFNDDDEAEIVLPASGLTVWAWVPGAAGIVGSVTVEALNIAGDTVATDSATSDAATITLPATTWSVRVTGAAVSGTRPILTTYRPAPAAGRSVVVPDGLCAVYPPPVTTAPGAPEITGTERVDGEATFTWGIVEAADRYLLTWGFDSGGPYPNAVEIVAPTVTATVSATGTDPVYAVVYAIADA